MKLIINESKLEKITIDWLNENFGDLTPFETDQYPNHIFYMKNGKVIFDYNKIQDVGYFIHKGLWEILKTLFGRDYKQIQDITKKWVEEHYNLKVGKTFASSILSNERWWKITT